MDTDNTKTPPAVGQWVKVVQRQAKYIAQIDRVTKKQFTVRGREVKFNFSPAMIGAQNLCSVSYITEDEAEQFREEVRYKYRVQKLHGVLRAIPTESLTRSEVEALEAVMAPLANKYLPATTKI